MPTIDDHSFLMKVMIAQQSIHAFDAVFSFDAIIHVAAHCGERQSVTVKERFAGGQECIKAFSMQLGAALLQSLVYNLEFAHLVNPMYRLLFGDSIRSCNKVRVTS